jgi:hypothetical protein
LERQGRAIDVLLGDLDLNIAKYRVLAQRASASSVDQQRGGTCRADYVDAGRDMLKAECAIISQNSSPEDGPRVLA